MTPAPNMTKEDLQILGSIVSKVSAENAVLKSQVAALQETLFELILKEHPGQVDKYSRHFLDLFQKLIEEGKNTSSFDQERIALLFEGLLKTVPGVDPSSNKDSK